MKLMHALLAILLIAWLFVVAAVGCCAAICGFRRIDEMCARQFERDDAFTDSETVNRKS
jgi:hypothetical protein